MNPVKIKTLYVFNKEIWPELLTQKDELSKLSQPYVDYSESGQVTPQFTDIPFEGSFIPYTWIAKNIIPLSNGTHDQIVFHMPTDQWKGGNTNGFTLAGHGRPTVICVHSFQGEQLFNNPDPKWKDRGFYERTQHEFAHAYCDIKGIQDAYEVLNPATGEMETHWKVHDIENAGGLWKQPWFDYIRLTQPQTTGKFASMQKVIDSLKAQLVVITAAINKGKLAILQEEIGAKWIGSPNKMIGRGEYKPEAIVIHIMDGTLSGTDSWFSTSKSMVSSHYGVGKTGTIHRYVREEDTAWHAGLVLNPTWKLIKSGISPNLYTIGIEHEGTADTVWPDAMKQASATLIKDICNRWKIPLDRDHIIGHYEIAGGHRPNCPSKNKGVVDELIALAKSK